MNKYFFCSSCHIVSDLKSNPGPGPGAPPRFHDPWLQFDFNIDESQVDFLPNLFVLPVANRLGNLVKTVTFVSVPFGTIRGKEIRHFSF